LTTEIGALPATDTMSVMGGYDAPLPASTFAVVHVVVPTLQLQPAPLMAVR
jgi:hypothetical protein